MLTLLDGAECTRVNWKHGLSDMSGFFYYMLKDMCPNYQLIVLKAIKTSKDFGRNPEMSVGGE